MAVTVYIPTPFRRATQNRDRVEAEAGSVGELLDRLEASYADLKGLVRGAGGELHHHVNIYVNSEAIESLSGLGTALHDGDEVTIIPALAGGQTLIVTTEELAAIHEQAIQEYPRESCGVIVVRGDERRLTRCRNVQDELHARDPERHPRDARTAYYIDPQDLLRLGRLEAEGFSVRVIYHSHIDAGAYFSETDRRQALMGDEPVYPEAIYLVTSVRGPAERAHVEATVGFAWDPALDDFAAVELDAPVR